MGVGLLVSEPPTLCPGGAGVSQVAGGRGAWDGARDPG